MALRLSINTRNLSSRRLSMKALAPTPSVRESLDLVRHLLREETQRHQLISPSGDHGCGATLGRHGEGWLARR
jgi:hypothetical protein